MQQESGRTIVLPPDPVPIAYPLPENYVAADNPLSTVGYNVANSFYPQPPQSLGGNIGNMLLNAGVNAAFDSATNKRAEYSAALSVSNSSFQNTVGKNWNADPSGTSLTITSTVAVQTHYVSSFTLYAPNDSKFLNSATGITGYHLDGSTDNSTWVTLYSSTTAGTVGETITATTTSATAYQYHRIAIQGDGISAVAIAQATLNVDGALSASSSTPVTPVTPTGWTNVSPVGPSVLNDIALSSDGTNLVVVENGGSIWTSTDSGGSWTERTLAGTKAWYSVAMSSDGSFIAAVWDSGADEGVAYSSDSGVSWNTDTLVGAVFPKHVSVSGDGTKIVVADRSASSFGGAGAIYLSTNSGASFAASAGAGTHSWAGVAISRDGTTIVAVGDDVVMVSANTGASWTDRTPVVTGDIWDGVAVSSDGSKIGVAKDTGLFYSTDSGVSFTELPSTTTFDVYEIAMSDDGVTILLGGDASENLMLSIDSGSTWTIQDPPIVDDWNIALSADGSVGAVVTGNTVWLGNI